MMNRRSFLFTLLKVACFVPLANLESFLFFAKRLWGENLLPKEEYLANILKFKKSSRIIGALYLSTHPQERNRSLLTSYLWPQQCPSWIPSKKRLKEHLDRQNKKDFEEGRVVSIQGWLLGLTEARLCALTALV